MYIVYITLNSVRTTHFLNNLHAVRSRSTVRALGRWIKSVLSFS